jgi:hypothetical protein
MKLTVSEEIMAVVEAAERELGLDREEALKRMFALFGMARDGVRAGMHLGLVRDPSRLDQRITGLGEGAAPLGPVRRTVTVRIAVAVDKDGKWTAGVGNHECLILDDLAEGEAWHWVEAELPIPGDPPVTRGRVAED